MVTYEYLRNCLSREISRGYRQAKLSRGHIKAQKYQANGFPEYREPETP
jgi:hypothetical protein